MKRTPALMLITLLLAMICFCSSASAEAVTGTTREATTFRVTANKNGYITLTSSLGTAMVAQHNWIGNYEQDGKERHYGFYQVMIQQKDGPFNQSFIWAPSATKNKGEVNTCVQLELRFPYTGTYTIWIVPLNNNQAKEYWRMDYIRYWIDPAQWVVSVENNCTAKKPKLEDTIDIEYLTRSGEKVGEKETRPINVSQTITPGPLPTGYVCISSPQYVTFDEYDGASPKNITFYCIGTTVDVTNIYINAVGNDVIKDTITKKYWFSQSGYAEILKRGGYYCISKPEWIVYSNANGVSKSKVTYVHVYGLSDTKYSSLHEKYYGSNSSYYRQLYPSSRLEAYAVTNLPETPDGMDSDFFAFLVKYANENPPTAAATNPPAGPSTTRKPGDANGDGKITLTDAMLIARKACGHRISINESNADVNQDGNITMTDAMLVARKACGHNVLLK